jgi:hypothetical protein
VSLSRREFYRDVWIVKPGLMMLDRDKLAKILGLLGSAESGEILSAGRAADALIRNANTSWAQVLNQNAVADEVRALRAENEKLRETAQQMLVENDALRKRTARRVVNRILDGARQCGQALIALVIAFDGTEFLRHQLAAHHHDSEPRSLRPVVVRSLVAAGIPLTLGIVAFLSLCDVAMLGEPWVRSGSVASSRQEAPEAAARSDGPPTQAERRAINSGRPPTAAMATPEPIPQPTPSEAALAPMEDLTTLRATLPPAIAASDQTTQAPEAPLSLASPAPAEKQAASPTTSPTTSPQATQSLTNQYPSAAETAALVARGDASLSTGDMVSARLFYERAAGGGDGGAALRLGATFDPGFLSRTRVRGAAGDPTQASSWYRRALDLGNPAAQERLKNLEQQFIPVPGSPTH